MGRGRRGGRSDAVAVTKNVVNPEVRQEESTSELKSPDMHQRVEESASTSNPPGQNPRKRQKRDEYRASIQYDGDPSAIELTELQLPKKKWFRQRAHANPFSDHRLAYPVGPELMDWSAHYPAFVKEESTTDNLSASNDLNFTAIEDSRRPTCLKKNVEIADIGCGFGGLLFALAPQRPDTLMLGLEIRTSVTEFVENKIRVLRQQQLSNPNPHQKHGQAHQEETSVSEDPVTGGYQNISVVRTNSMKFLPNFFPRGSLKTIFLCFPDPHFKNRKHKARIVSSTMNSEYAYVLREGGFVAAITDVEELSQWMAERFDMHESFERVIVDESRTDESVDTDEEREARWLVKVMKESTEEGKKVDRFGGSKFVGVWKRRKDPDWPGE